MYAECMALELSHDGIGFDTPAAAPVYSYIITMLLGFRADIIVENTIIF
jgi:hypothetical protein